ncbi:MAG: hypothetical protein ACI849_000283 [Patiriisocius sp.]|jgi:hypothetical protein
MLLKPKILLYIITVAVIVAAVVWEYYMQQWLSYQPDAGADVMRVDLFVIWPVVLTLVGVSLFRIFDKKR